ncbi:hypothetical protein [Paracraurococcus ruber]|uniref:Uncharacterized protein n=1 Tax=Paracraurococcus ruber TaxID=77675 RepID=A0ABS1D249_9PROT|nr:hypothetical protein [Paracraurococcus ruber]MBK1660505.1 hypothetical protein [Paracraurococcus ruber]TDG27455.1 hypothetical protein E2C05_22815 [Paracraurococcus ruber]
MPAPSEQRLFDALATLSRACAEGGLPEAGGPPPEDAGVTAMTGMDAETREVLGEASLAVAFGAFADQGGDGGPLHMLIGAMALLALRQGEEPDPPAEIMAIVADDARVEAEIDRAGEAVDAECGPDAPAGAVTAVLEAQLLGAAIQLAGCTVPEAGDRGAADQAAVRLRAARILARLAAGLMAMNLAHPRPA